MADEREAGDDVREADDGRDAAADEREVADDDTVRRAESREHLEDIDGCAGCVEVWEHLSEQREAAADEETGRGSAE